ncbi:PREDICTED: mini-chromosome maintenance complex-binding protein [Ceratosolen solmsi marchali]|uniref:Mini-chromosome maintenance complex-binding protein n=1 Tax=Ceratosolen solmsi marchali TaxID=326594 RepID=A0AAJ6YBL7_9HYME|nr:PREDICTED: mini-chromosome maintenance complex-binding protein [Ceratosolen solmsi marchali]
MIIKPCDWTVDYYLNNEENCNKSLEELDKLQEIPSLNYESLDNFRDGQLVRFQGMLQDMYNPEYYFKKYEVIDTKTGERSSKCGMYIDSARCKPHERVSIDSSNNESSERQTWIVISTPGLNDWAKGNQPLTKRIRTCGREPSTSDCNKRGLNQTDEQMDCSEPVKKKDKKITDNNTNDASVLQLNESTPMIVSKDYLLNFPIPNENGKACIVKVYKEYPQKLNQIIDIVGFLSLDPNLGETVDSDEMLSDLERQTHHPPASIVPRLHAIKIVNEISEYSDNSGIISMAEGIRGDLRMILSQLLFGDEIAADYLICHLISSVYLRKDYLCLGNFSLNITNIPKEYENFTKDFYEILKQIIAKSHFLNITLETLNEMNFVPKKDYDCNRLTTGILQLSDNTHLIIDETNLTTGQLTVCGRQNYGAMTDLTKFQKLAYDFKFYNMNYETDIPVLILSDVKSFIPCETQIMLKPDPDSINMYPRILEAATQYLKDEGRLNNIRQYVNTLKKVKFEISDETTNIIQDDFVKLRQNDEKFSADNLHLLMVLSRLMSLSYGFKTLTPEMWKRSLEMEMERKNRLLKRNRN